MRKFRAFITMIIAVLLTAMVACPSWAATRYGLDGNIKKCYIKDGKYKIIVHMDNNSSYNRCVCSVSADSESNERADFVCFTCEPQKSRDYSLSIPLSKLKPGAYTLTLRDDYGNFLNKRVIKYKCVAKLSFKKSSRSKWNDAPAQRFTFKQKYCKGKKLFVEIYDESGKLLTKEGRYTVSTTDNGNYNFYWSYFPEHGPRCKSGNYSIKYWVEGGPFKQEDLYLKI